MSYDPETQDILDRRVYVVRPLEELVAKLTPILSQEDISDLLRPTVVMTEELFFEKHLEGWRRSILKKCKHQFISEQLEFGLLYEVKDIESVLGCPNNAEEFFDKWFCAEEAEYTQIETNWHVENA